MTRNSNLFLISLRSMATVYKCANNKISKEVCMANQFYKFSGKEIRGAFNKFPENCYRLLKIQYVIAIHLMR